MQKYQEKPIALVLRDENGSINHINLEYRVNQ